MRPPVPSLCALLAGAALTLPAPAEAQPAERIFQRANEAYFQGDYASAVEQYQLLVEAGVDDPDVSFNLATSYAKLGRYGHAIRWFEHALRLEPGDDAAERGLRAAYAALGRRQAEAEGEATLRTRPPFTEALVRPIRESTLAWMLLVLDVLFFGALIVRGRMRSETGRLALGIALPLLGALLAASVAGLVVKTGLLREGDPAVVLEQNAPVREGPDPRAQERTRGREGESARIVDRQGEWVRVELAGAREGWMWADDVGTL